MNTYIKNKSDYIDLKNNQQFGGSQYKSNYCHKTKSKKCRHKNKSKRSIAREYSFNLDIIDIPHDFVLENLDEFKKDFEEPFSFIRENKNDSHPTYSDERYELQNISITMFNNDMEPEKINLLNIDLDNGIEKVYMYQKDIGPVEGGMLDRSWWFIGMLNDIHDDNKKYYVYYEADCDSTGFDCQGVMTLYISEHLDRIIRFGLPEKVRVKFYKKLKLL